MKISGDKPVQETAGKQVIELHERAHGTIRDKLQEGTQDRVSISPQAYDLLKIKQAVEAAPDVRKEKVALLKEKIASGEYDVDARKVAEKMIREFLLEDTLKS